MSTQLEEFSTLDVNTVQFCKDLVNYFKENRTRDFNNINFNNFQILFKGINLYYLDKYNCWEKVTNNKEEKTKKQNLKYLIEMIVKNVETLTIFQNLLTYLTSYSRGSRDNYEYVFTVQHINILEYYLNIFKKFLETSKTFKDYKIKVDERDIKNHLIKNVFDDYTNLIGRISVGVIITKMDKDKEVVLLVKNRLWEEYKTTKGKYSFPKGGIKTYYIGGEEIKEQPIDTASRELFEETGIFIHPKILQSCNIFEGNFGNLYYIYKVDDRFQLPFDENGKIKINPFQRGEILDIGWFSVESLRSSLLPLNSDLKKFVESKFGKDKKT